MRRLLAVVAAAACVAAPSLAEIVDVFEVKDVAVDISAETAAAARERALADGQMRAFRRLLERLTLRADQPRLPRLSLDGVAGLLRDFSVADEKTSAVRYLARVTYRFRPEAVRRLLLDNGLAFAETASKPLVVLPVYRAAAALLLWDDPNPWRDAWRELATDDSLVPKVVPQGDLTDIATIGAEPAVAGDTQRLVAIAGRYGGGDALVAQAAHATAASGLPQLDVTIARYGSTLQEQTVVRSFVANPGEGIDGLLRRAARETAAQVEDNWKRDNRLRFERSGVLAVTVPVKRLEDWLEIRRRLSGVAVVRRIDLVLLSRDEVRINIHYIGEAGQLALALEQADLALEEDGGEHVLAVAGAGRDRT